MKLKTFIPIIALTLLAGCGTKIEIEDCDNSFVLIEQSSTQRTDNEIPVSLTEASRVLKDLVGIPKIVADPAGDISGLVEVNEPADNDNISVTRVETYQTEYVEGNPKPFTWLKNPGVAGEILFELVGCEPFKVPDGSTKYSPGGHGQATYFQGSDTPEGLRMNGRASVFMAPKCANGILTVTFREVK